MSLGKIKEIVNYLSVKSYSASTIKQLKEQINRTIDNEISKKENMGNIGSPYVTDRLAHQVRKLKEMGKLTTSDEEF